jgi:hypothetical protein
MRHSDLRMESVGGGGGGRSINSKSFIISPSLLDDSDEMMILDNFYQVRILYTIYYIPIYLCTYTLYTT